MADEFDKGIEELDREIGMRLRAALDDVEPDEAASARMLTALKDAEAMRKVTAEAAGGEGAHADIRQRATGTGNAAPRPRGRIAVWKVAAPIAAVLIVAAIGFGVGFFPAVLIYGLVFAKRKSVGSPESGVGSRETGETEEEKQETI